MKKFSNKNVFLPSEVIWNFKLIFSKKQKKPQEKVCFTFFFIY
jgi:hypothetical protein